MVNSVLLVGDIVEIYSTSFVIKTHDGFNIMIDCVPEENIAQLLLNNTVGVRGHLESNGVNGEELSVVLNRLTILDGRGKKND